MESFEEVLPDLSPDMVLVVGDVNSTIACALVAVKCGIPVGHVEAGLRSFDRTMPEEINRLLTDQISAALYVSEASGVANLRREGVPEERIHFTGNTMIDTLVHLMPRIDAARTAASLGLEHGGYALVTLHRPSNVDDPVRLAALVDLLAELAGRLPVVFPVHPRTRGALDKLDVKFGDNVRLVEPVGYFDMMVLEENARIIATDSGGVQREAYFMQKPCITLRDETEWTETVQVGWNKLVGVEVERIVSEWKTFTPPAEQPPIFGDGKAGEKIAEILSKTTLSIN